MILWAATWIAAILGFAFMLTLVGFATLYAYESGFLWVWAPFLGLIVVFAVAPAMRRRKPRATP